MAGFRYACPRCHRCYDTADEATNCTKVPAEHFKPGDLVWDGTYSGIYQINYVEENRYAAGVTRIQLAAVAQGWEPRKLELDGRGYMIGSFWCKATLFPVEEARKLLREARRKAKKRVDAAEELLRMVEAGSQAKTVAS